MNDFRFPMTALVALFIGIGGGYLLHGGKPSNERATTAGPAAAAPAAATAVVSGQGGGAPQTAPEHPIDRLARHLFESGATWDLIAAIKQLMTPPSPAPCQFSRP